MEKVTVESVAKQSCTGCGLCAQLCPKKCIAMQQDEEGFFAPAVNTEMCISCGICLGACPVADASESLFYKDTPTYFCANASDKELLKKSSSGGVFGLLAEQVLASGGKVCGCVYDEAMHPVHILTNDKCDVERMFGSKYVQSNAAVCFPEIKESLLAGTEVLFTGTACQVAALRNFLKKDYEGLCTAEILCHGVPSPGFFATFVARLEKKLKGKVLDVQFRNKEKGGWGSEHRTCVVYRDKKGNVRKYRPTLPAYFSAFFYGLSLRESCYQCKFARNERIADLTLGDFWGSWNKYQRRFIEGISVVAVNTERGKALTQKIKERLDWFDELTAAEAMRSNDNFYHPVKRPPERSDFYRDLQTGKYRGYWKKAYFTKTYRRKTLASVYGAFVPAKIRYALHKIKKK